MLQLPFAQETVSAGDAADPRLLHFTGFPRRCEVAVSAAKSFVPGQKYVWSQHSNAASCGGEVLHLAVGRRPFDFWRNIILASHLEPTPGGSGPFTEPVSSYN